MKATEGEREEVRGWMEDDRLIEIDFEDTFGEAGDAVAVYRVWVVRPPQEEATA
ncbi:hypothetical protein LCGC14_1875250 [marine sediment metagenome]|uniref:Uncharacterized protein n=1 Tax=marine sediment metagenome TaxID=412755 RepID=A0A0F9G3T8_9ZZZZ